MSRGNEERLWTLYMMFDRTQHIASRHARPGAATTAPRATRTRGYREETPHAALDAFSARARASRRRPSVSHSTRVSIFHQSTHIPIDCADRARDAENSRGGKKGSAIDSKPLLNPKTRAIHRARVASSRRVSAASRSIIDGERSFFRSRAFVFAENVPMRQTQTRRETLRGLCRRLVPGWRRFPGASRYDGERAMSARTRLDSTRETRRARDEEKCLESVRTRVVLVDLDLEHDVVK